MDSNIEPKALNAPEPSMQLLAEVAQTQSRNLTNDTADTSDRDDGSSSLSELDDQQAMDGADNNDGFSHEPRPAPESDEEEEEDDTEAETERLEESPQKQRQQKQVLLSGGSTVVASVVTDNDAGATASSLNIGLLTKSNKKETKEEEDEEEDDDEVEEEEQDGAPQTSDISSLDDSVEASEPETTSSSSSKKRKRNPEEDTQRSLKKVALELANHVADQADDTVRAQTPHDVTMENHRPMREQEASEDDGEESGPEEQGDEHIQPNMNGGSHDAADSNEEDADMEDVEPETDAASAARSEEERMKKKSAIDLLAKIEANFAMLRDKLFAEKNQQLTNELATMQSERITHPEYLAMVDAIEQLRKDRLKHAQTLYNYKVQALRNRSIANRAQTLSQFVQRARDLRETALENIGKEWYQIQRGRRRIDEEEEPTLNHFTGSHMDHVVQHTAYNTEVSILSGVARYVGFPAAPMVAGASQAEVEDDLRQMEVSIQPVNVPIASIGGPSLQFGRQRVAVEEQWSGPQPSWANPQHPIHSINNVQHQTSNPLRSVSPFTTPAQNRASDIIMGSASTIAAFPSSSLAPTPMSTEDTQQKTSKSTMGTSTDPATDTPSRAPTEGSTAVPNNRKPLTKTKGREQTNLEYETSKASPAQSHPLPAAVDELRQHVSKASPNRSRSRKESPGVKQDPSERRFTPQPRLQASVEMINS